MSNLFIAVATGQNVANIPPMLQLGKAGDSVLWILSPQAKKARYHLGASEVLKKRGFQILPAVEISNINNPREIILKSPELREISSNFAQSYIILNGGQKLTPIALIAMLRGKEAISNAALLYGQAQPAELWLINPENLQITTLQYEKDISLRFEEFLEINGYKKTRPESEALCWSFRGAIKNGCNETPRYPENFEDINKLHSLHYMAAKIPEGKFPRLSFDDWESAQNKEIFRQWRTNSLSLIGKCDKCDCQDEFKNLYGITLAMWGIKGLMPKYESLDYEKEFKPILDKVSTMKARKSDALRCLYSQLARRCEKIIRDSMRQKLGIPNLDANLGFAFEGAVKDRLVKWLEINKQYVPITELWANVSIGREGATEAEIDLGLLLANGILIHLECKAANAEVKDIDARLANLHAVFSQLAVLCLVSPAYSQASNEHWFKYIEEKIWPKFEKFSKVKLLKFTLPAQPRSYERKSSSGIPNIPPRTISLEIKPFEESLNELIKPYCQ